jgi:uncharacterized membrane protein
MRSSIVIGLAAAAVAACSGPAGNNSADANVAQGNGANAATTDAAGANAAAPRANDSAPGDEGNAFEPVPIGPQPNRTANYRASGTEPFWSLTIANGEMRYERPGNIVGADTPEPRQVPNGVEFRTPLLTARFTRRPCTEASGQTVRYTVRVRAEGRTVTGCGQ